MPPAKLPDSSDSQTTMRGDGQVIVIPFNSTPVELSPGFRCSDGNIPIDIAW
jgi:hypothetical protein